MYNFLVVRHLGDKFFDSASFYITVDAAATSEYDLREYYTTDDT